VVHRILLVEVDGGQQLGLGLTPRVLVARQRPPVVGAVARLTRPEQRRLAERTARARRVVLL
jgi:hypothetical protein